MIDKASGGQYLGQPTGRRSDQTDTAALCFRTQHDALDYASHGIEQRNRVFALNNLFRIADNYRIGELSLRLMLRLGQKQYDLVFVSVEAGAPKDARAVEWLAWKTESSLPEGVRDQQSVLLGVCDIIQCKQGVIPSFVSLEGFKERHNLSRQILQTIDFVRPMGRVARKRKMRGILAPTVLDLDSPCHLIEAAAQIVDSIEHDARQVVREGSVEAGYVGISPGFTISFNDIGVWFVRRECSDLGFEICDMVICATENTLGASE